jgi:aryl-alcohol dehydrogenase-like predicted oxidoreductase
MPDFNRRTVIAGMSAGALLGASPSSGNVTSAMPEIGMGTWLTFDVGNDTAARDARVQVLRAFFDAGGRMVDSSPMYGSSEAVLGYCLEKVEDAPVYAASKVWIPTVDLGDEQMEASRSLWGIPRFDLMQVHNLLGYEGHIETLRAMKQAGAVGEIGITTSHGRRHDRFTEIMQSDGTLDTVQFTYNMLDREAEDRLLPIAAERELSVIVNRPFQRGALIRRLSGKPLPPFAGDLGITSWPQFLLKWVTSHPAVTVAIPATSKVAHMRENMAMLSTPIPDAATRQRMLAWVLDL